MPNRARGIGQDAFARNLFRRTLSTRQLQSNAGLISTGYRWHVLLTILPSAPVPTEIQVRTMTYQLTFACGEKGCRETATVLCETSRETIQQLRQRNPIFVGIRCAAKHLGAYDAASALDITEFLYLPRVANYFAKLPGRVRRAFQNPK